MAEDKKVFQESINYRGNYSYGEIYRFVRSLIESMGYRFEEKRAFGEPRDGKKFVITKVDCLKKITDYFQLKIGLQIASTFEKSYKQKTKGKEVLDYGDLNIGIDGYLISDYSGRWEKKPLFKFLRGFYDKFIINKDVERYEGMVAGEAQELVLQIRAFLGMERLG